MNEMMDINMNLQSTSNNNCSTAMEDDSTDNSVGANTREGTSPRLQQKIDVVQQILTLLEQTMAVGKSTHEQNVAGVQATIENLQRSIDSLKTQLVTSETEFSQFSSIVGGEINKFCALDNILRTVEESRTENDVKILLPDVSKIDKFVHLYATNKADEWERLKCVIVRLNAESQADEPVVRCITLKVTLKTKKLNGLESDRVNCLASIINESRGKSLNRYYQSTQIPEYTVKYLKITWNQKNVVAAASVNSNTIKIVKEAFKDEGEVVNIETINGEETIQAVNAFQDILPNSVSNSQSTELQQSFAVAPKSFLLYCVGQSNSNTSNSIVEHSTLTSINLKNTPRSAGEDIEIIREVKRSAKIRIDSSTNIQPTASGSENTVIPPLISQDSTTHSQQQLLNSVLNGGATQNDTLEAISVNAPITENSTGRENTALDVSSNNFNATIRSIINEQVSCNSSVSQTNNEQASSAATFHPPHEAIPPKVPKVVDACKAADRYANSKIRKLLAVTLTMRKDRHIVQQSAICQNDNLLEDSEMGETSVAPKDDSPSALPSTSVLVHNDAPVSEPSKEPNNNNLLEKEPEEYLDGICLKNCLIRECRGNGIVSLRDVQKEFLTVFNNKKDVMCRADKRSGLSTAISMSALQSVDTSVLSSQVLVATATLSCAEKLTATISKLGMGMKVICRNADELTAGSSSSSSYMELYNKSKSHILVGIPASLHQLLQAQRFQNETVTCLMIDDFDKMLAQRYGLKATILKILYSLNASIQVVVMTKKLTPDVEEFRKNLRNPVIINLPERESADVSESQGPDQKQNKMITNGKKRRSPSKTSQITASHSTRDRHRSKESKSMRSDDCQYVYDITISSPPQSSGSDTVLFGEEEDDVFTSESDTDDESSMSLSTSTDPEVVDEIQPLSVSRRSSVEIETLLCADGIFGRDDEIMTVIPEYIYKSLGIPMKVEFPQSNMSACNLDNDEGTEGTSHFYAVLYEDILKVETLSLLDIEDERTVIFCNSVEKVESLSSTLRQRNLWPQAMHEDMSRNEWSPVLRNFMRGLCKLVVATDFLAELTICGASLVINYEFPDPSRNYLTRAAFAERCVGNAEYSGSGNRDPMIVSFIAKEQLPFIEDLKKTFNVLIQPMSND